MIFMTVPIFSSVLLALGFNVVWFCVVVAIMVGGIMLITPPIGLKVFVLKSMLPEGRLSSNYLGIRVFFCGKCRALAVVSFYSPGSCIFAATNGNTKW